METANDNMEDRETAIEFLDLCEVGSANDNNKTEIDFLEPGVIEGLIEDGRIPMGFGIISDEEGKDEATFFVPPEGTKRGDGMGGDTEIGYYFVSPEGEDRGYAEMHTVPVEIGQKIREKVDAVFRAMKKNSIKL